MTFLKFVTICGNTPKFGRKVDFYLVGTDALVKFVVDFFQSISELLSPLHLIAKLLQRAADALVSQTHELILDSLQFPHFG